ncbi:aliphatic sulfonate ABC transporter substrate-binding protein [Leptolyngbya sp. NK1-12]|uniref:Putative aliphatic sulfonates-binding protein n=1 Tax=Leptolyngbya sp. NK1-12 TaxID=2547451 RepID=A0AA96WKD0_9CYAN|nr:aliphatic sulfonate ABC transporter substrate-binding protein [Leptolyngbya sp. NK1-12]WNZ27013.1 aliphatic sulfonate ABC transporter substrate-binding protein [Leptolyngbya sp. NK1-12]
MYLKRRTVLSGLIGFSIPLIVASCASNSSNNASNQASSSSDSSAANSPSTAGTTVRIGYQKATELDLLRSRGNLDKRIQELGGTIEWSLFPSGPPMLEAMNAGKIDFGGVGESPPIFSQAAGGQFYYASVTPLAPETQDIVVPSNSPIQSPADLKGKKVALQKGSSAHYLLLKVLEENNIDASEVEVVSLSPADARAAFEQGNVDAWSIWDPFLAVVQANGNIRELKVGRERRTFFLSAQQFAETQPESLKVVLDEAKQNGEWVKQNIREVAERFSKDIKVDVAILEEVYKRRSWDVLPVDESVQQAQQQVADIFYKAQVIPKSIQVKEAFLAASDYTKIFPS